MQTIELDQLLYDPIPATPEQVHQFWRYGEFHDEQYLVAAIKRYLLTESHKQILNQYDFSIEDMLNGRVDARKVPRNIVHSIFRDWNVWLNYDTFAY